MIIKQIKIILTNKIDKIDINSIWNDKIELQNSSTINSEIYEFDEKKSNEEELKKIVTKINKSENRTVYFITNKKNLFEFFNRNIICKYVDNEENFFFSTSYENEYTLKLNQLNLYIGITNDKYIDKFFFKNISEVLNKYGNIFNIDIYRLVKGTTYKVNNKEELKNLIYEDLQLINSNQIITSRLAIVFYRLTYFDLDATKVFIGRYFKIYFGKSESFNINLNRNPNGYFFTDLNNKIFRGYRIKPIIFIKPDSNLDLRIRFAKRLLSKKVNKNIVAESLELSIEEIDLYIYNIQNNNKINIKKKVNEETETSVNSMTKTSKKIIDVKKNNEPYISGFRLNK